MCFGHKTFSRKFEKPQIGHPSNFRVVQHVGLNDANLNYEVQYSTVQYMFNMEHEHQFILIQFFLKKF